MQRAPAVTGDVDRDLADAGLPSLPRTAWLAVDLDRLAGWLAQRPVAQLPAPDWLAHVEPVRAEREEDQEARILELHEDGRSMREIESQVYGYTGGKAHERVRQVVQSATTTTATGATGVVAAAAA